MPNLRAQGASALRGLTSRGELGQTRGEEGAFHVVLGQQQRLEVGQGCLLDTAQAAQEIGAGSGDLAVSCYLGPPGPRAGGIGMGNGKSAPSTARMSSLVLAPPPAEKPPIFPPDATMRWHGTMTANGLRPSACPTDLAAPGAPIRLASAP